MPRIFVITPEPIDLSAVELPPYIEARISSQRSNIVGLTGETEAALNAGYEALCQVYPNAEQTTSISTALRWAYALPGSRLQIASNVSAETKAQVAELMRLGYSVRDVLTVAVEKIHQEKFPAPATKPPVGYLQEKHLGMVPEDFRDQDLDFLQDAIQIRRHEHMAARLHARGIECRVRYQRAFDDTEVPDFLWYPDYIWVVNPAAHNLGVWATLFECQRLLDTVANLPPAQAYERWLPKVAETEVEPYTEGDARRDTREARAQLRRDLEAGKIDGRDYAELYRGTSFMDLVE